MSIRTPRIVSALVAAILPLHAGIIFDQSPPSNSGNGSDIVSFRLADDFSLSSPAALNNVSFWYYAQFQTDLSSVAWAVYATSGGSLGGVLQSGVSSPNTSADGNAFLASFPISSLNLAAGAYWLEVHAGSSLIDTGNFAVSWAAVDDNASLPALSSSAPAAPSVAASVSGFEQFAFQLGGDPVPEPSVGWLAMSGLAGLLAIRRAQRSSRTG